MSRLTATVTCDELAYEQLIKQLHKLISVYKISDLTNGEVIARELILVRVGVTPEKRGEVIEIANVFRAKIVDVGKNSITIEATGDADKLSGMVNLLRAYGVREIIRTGRIAMQRSTHEN